NGISSIAGDNSVILNIASSKQGFTEYLNNQGIDFKDFSGFLAPIKNSLSNQGQGNAFFIEQSSIPGAGEVMFKLGLGAGDVKKAIENSVNGKGELETGRLTAELNKYLAVPVKESELISIFAENNIFATKRIFKKPDMKIGPDNLSASSTKGGKGAIEKGLKLDIEKLLRENGTAEDGISLIMKKVDSAIDRYRIEQHTNLSASGIRKTAIPGVDRAGITGSDKNSIKQDILAILKENGISFDKTGPVFRNLDSVFAGLAIHQNQAKERVSAARNSISKMGEENRVISSMFENTSVKGIKNRIDTLRVNYRNTDLNQNHNLRFSLLNEKVPDALKNNQAQPPENQGNLRLNPTELVRTLEKRSDLDFTGKSTGRGTHPEAGIKASLSGKDKGIFTIKETNVQTSISMLNANSIRDTDKTGLTDSGSHIPQPLPKIVEKIIFMFRSREYQSRLQITPPELGKLDIDLTIKNGRVQANMCAESSAVKEIIEANLNQLKQQLSNQGLTIDKLDVMVGTDIGERKEGSTWAHEKENKGSRQSNGLKEDESTEISAIASITKVIRGNNKIDVHV
ncbi:MAG: hypothetical protein GX846_11885, partial [Deltaproteobacteria bacterium]|nr:hypothetical protein [Deltaproteobacteria bacterium]